MKKLKRYFKLAALWIIGVVAGLIGGIAVFISNSFFLLIDLAIASIFPSLVIWVAFNLSIGAIIGLQISFIQSFAFIFLIKSIKGAIA